MWYAVTTIDKLQLECYNHDMNKPVEKFLTENDYDFDNADYYSFCVKSDADINPFLIHFYIPGKSFKTNVSIANILGYSYESFNLSCNLISNLSRYFDEEGTSYQVRSLGMLTMDRETCIETMKKVSIDDTVHVRECDENKYIITSNGMHRYHVLRFHYLNELSKIDANDETQIKQLQEKYTIPVEVKQPDYFKTYAYFILNRLNPEISLSNEYDSNFNTTGNAVVKIGNNIKVYTDSELLLLLQQTIKQNSEEFNRLADRLKYYQEELPTFRNFLCNNNINISTEAFSI